MSAITERARLDPVIDEIYETALAPKGWPALLGTLASLFQAGFADVFARTEDRSDYKGLAHGLDRSDYQDEFLGTWFNRNVWGLTSPPKATGEIAQTREMLPHADLMRSDIFNLYLDRRGLHEGLRLAIFVGDGWVQDLSLLRPFSLGPYQPHEIAMAEILLPHLQRAAAVTRRLGEMNALLEAGLSALDGVNKAAFLLDAGGQVLRQNSQAEALVSKGDCVTLRGGMLHAAAATAVPAMQAALARLGDDAGERTARMISLPRRGGSGGLVLTLVPLSPTADWSTVRPPASIAFLTEQDTDAPLSLSRLMQHFGLTTAEAELALDLLEGQGLGEIAARRRRSVNTVRTHLRNLMGKTLVHRQADLIRLLMGMRGG